MLAWAKDNGKDGALVDLSTRLASQFDKNSGLHEAAYSCLIDEVGQVTDVVKEFDAMHQDDSTYCYWRQYMHLVSILLRFTRSEEIGNFICRLFLRCFRGLQLTIIKIIQDGEWCFWQT